MNEILEKPITKSEFFRSIILDNFQEEYIKQEKEFAFNGLLYFFNKASNNINQLAKGMHQEKP